jgi:hypothetical protein
LVNEVTNNMNQTERAWKRGFLLDRSIW